MDANYSTAYVYGHDGQRSSKYTHNSETLYFSRMWTLHTDSGNNVYGGQTAKNIYLGEMRIVTKLNSGSDPTYQEECHKQYYYHSDHLRSASLISDYKGDEYQRIEYTPYGETWVEKTSNTGLDFLPYKFTAKELDKETGLYYYGARYLDPKYSRWISTDPALGEYMRGSSVGEGGIYNSINLSLYHYGGNNPIRYTDPTGAFDWDTNTIESGDTLIQIANDCNTRYGTNYTADDLQELNSDTISDKDKIYDGNHLNLGTAETVQKKVTEYKQRVTMQVSKVNGLDILFAQKKQSTFSSWWSKKAGEKLTDDEIKLQKGVGIGEMVAGPTLGIIGCAQTGGQSVLMGYYVMADGAVMVAKAEKGVKAIPGVFFLNLLCPVAGTTNDIPVVVEYNMSPLPAGKYR